MSKLKDRVTQWTTYTLALAVAASLGLAVAFGLTTATAFVAPVQAAPATGDTECVLWADIKPWGLTRCESWETGEVCFIATSGFVVCKWDY